MAVVTLVCLYFGKYTFVPYVWFLIAGSLIEYLKAIKKIRPNVMIGPAAVLLLIPILVPFSKQVRPDMIILDFFGNSINLFGAILSISFVLGVLLLVFKNEKYKFLDFAYSFFGGLYFSFLYSYTISIRLHENHGFALMLLAIVLCSSSDSFALFSGKLFGKHKLCPTISPNKTVEGAVGAIICTALISFVFGLVCFFANVDLGIRLWHYPIIGVLISFAAQIGDLFASIIKRECGIKDFGKIFPGHGGVLDRVDSYGFASALMFLYMEMFLWQI